jgi:hypothetical protein
MGRYLATAITNKIEVSKSNIQEAKYNIDKLKEDMENKFLFDINLYDIIEDDYKVTFTLKSDVINTQLKPFLTEIYPDLYSEKEDYINVIKYIDNKTTSEIIEYSKNKSEFAFQYSKEPYVDSIDCDFGERIIIDYETIILFLEGKIIMECYGKLFNFFKKNLIQVYKKYPIASSIKIYITS